MTPPLRASILSLLLLSPTVAFSVQALPETLSEETSKSPRAVFEAAASNVQTYEQLLHAIRGVRTESRQRIEQTVDQEKVREAWETGKLIHEHILLHKERAEYDKQILVRLANDLGTSKTELYYMLQFVRIYPIFPAPGKLSWAHYRELLSVNDSSKREAMAKEAVNKGWSQKELFREIKKRKLKNVEESPIELAEVKPGILNTYQIFKQDDRLRIDLGFDTYFDLPKQYEKKVKEGIVTFDGKRTKPATPNDLYTYQAKVLKVIDGDTFYALIDLGFGVSLHQRLRLRRLDAPEILPHEMSKSRRQALGSQETSVLSEGLEAKAILEKILSRAKGSILIQTSKTNNDDQYGRYLVDVWMKGKDINHELLTAGLFTIRGDE